MGLSDNERHSKVIWSVHNLTKLSEGLVGEGYWHGKNPYLAIKELLQQMWSILLSNSRNNSFWLLGSDESVESDNNSLWSTALYHNIKYCFNPNTENDAIEKLKEKKRNSSEDYLYNYVGEQFKIVELLNGDNRIVQEIKPWIENIQYATNRYSDETSKGYASLNELVSKIQGYMFSIWEAEKGFSKAWLIREIAILLAGPTSLVKIEKADALQQWVNKHCIHHNIKSNLKNLEIHKLKEILSSLTKNHTLKNRCRIMISIVGSDVYKYKKQYEPFRELAKSIGINVVIKVVKKVKQESEYVQEREYYRQDLLAVNK